ncbi:MAG: glycosyltransferase family 4 protein [Methanoregula sp.]|nr:glycosyltransferase family 4 protein [Methanoregula sp.]
MKIAIITSSFPRHRGDYQGNFIYHQAHGQVERGNEVHVICPHIPGVSFHEIMDGIVVHRFPYFYPYRFQCLASDTGMYSALRHSFVAMVQLPLFLISELWCSWLIIHRHQIDLIHSHWFIPSGFVGAVVAFIWRKPHVITSHVLDANLFGKFRFSLPLLSAIVASADMITTNSSYTKQQIEALVPLPCTCRVIPMGVILPNQIPPVKDFHGHTILFVGRLVEWKGVDTLIRSMTLVKKAIPNSRLTIVGEGPFRDSLQRLVQDAGLTDAVRFYGRATDDDLTKLYDSAAVFVLPSRRYQGLVMEGLGVVLLEAMSHRVPVIGSNVGGIPDIIDDGRNGFLFPSENEKILAEKIVTLLSDTVIAERFRLAGYETVRTRFSWEEISRQFSEAYEQVLDKYSLEGTT